MIYVSTNMYQALSFEKVYTILDALDFPLGIEIFPMFHHPDYEALLDKNRDRLKEIPLTFHEPYYKTDHSLSEGEVFQRTQDYFTRLLAFKDLGAKYIVYHYNNRRVQDKKVMVQAARDNLDHWSSQSPIPLLIENVGVKSRGNVLFNQEEFTEEVLSRKESCLIDLGHAYANGWDIPLLIESLKGKIQAYHLHTNDGFEDAHQSIFKEGMGPNMEETLDLIMTYTPNADLVLEYAQDYEDQEDLVVQDLKQVQSLLGQ